MKKVKPVSYPDLLPLEIKEELFLFIPLHILKMLFYTNKSREKLLFSVDLKAVWLRLYQSYFSSEAILPKIVDSYQFFWDSYHKQLLDIPEKYQFLFGLAKKREINPLIQHLQDKEISLEAFAYLDRDSLSFDYYVSDCKEFNDSCYLLVKNKRFLQQLLAVEADRSGLTLIHWAARLNQIDELDRLLPSYQEEPLLRLSADLRKHHSSILAKRNDVNEGYDLNTSITPYYLALLFHHNEAAHLIRNKSRIRFMSDHSKIYGKSANLMSLAIRFGHNHVFVNYAEIAPPALIDEREPDYDSSYNYDRGRGLTSLALAVIYQNEFAIKNLLNKNANTDDAFYHSAKNHLENREENSITIGFMHSMIQTDTLDKAKRSDKSETKLASDFLKKLISEDFDFIRHFFEERLAVSFANSVGVIDSKKQYHILTNFMSEFELARKVLDAKGFANSEAYRVMEKLVPEIQEFAAAVQYYFEQLQTTMFIDLLLRDDVTAIIKYFESKLIIAIEQLFNHREGFFKKMLKEQRKRKIKDFFDSYEQAKKEFNPELFVEHVSYKVMALLVPEVKEFTVAVRYFFKHSEKQNMIANIAKY